MANNRICIVKFLMEDDVMQNLFSNIVRLYKSIAPISLLDTFKYTTIIHIFCVLFNLTIYRYLNLAGYTDEIIYYTDYAATIIICWIMTIKIMEFIIKKNTPQLRQHFIIGTLLEYSIAFILLVIFFFNKSISKKFIIYLATLSKQASNNDIIFIMFLLFLYFLYYLYEMQDKKIDLQSEKSISGIIFLQTTQLIIKIMIIGGIILQSINPLLFIFNTTEIQDFQKVIFHFTSTTFLFYIHSIAIILMGMSIIELLHTYRKKNI
jgi:hypothetical protein